MTKIIHCVHHTLLFAIFLLFAIGILLGLASLAMGHDIYVSPSADGSNAGTKEKTLATLNNGILNNGISRNNAPWESSNTALRSIRYLSTTKRVTFNFNPISPP